MGEKSKSCPLQPPATSFQDLIPDVVNIIFKYLKDEDDRKNILSCRLVCKTWRSYLNCDLHMAAADGELDTVKKLIAEGRNVNHKLHLGREDVRGWTPSHGASENCVTPQHVEIGKLLIEAGAGINLKDGHDYTPLHHAIIGGEYSGEFLRMLLKAGAKTEGRTQLGTPIFFTTWNNTEQEIEILKILIEGGASVNARDEIQRNTLLHAVFEESRYKWMEPEENTEKKIKIIIEAGANVNAINHDGNTPLHLMVVRAVENLYYTGRGVQNPLENLSMMLAAGGDKLIRNRENETPFEYANNSWKLRDIILTVEGRQAMEKVQQLLSL